MSMLLRCCAWLMRWVLEESGGGGRTWIALDQNVRRPADGRARCRAESPDSHARHEEGGA